MMTIHNTSVHDSQRIALRAALVLISVALIAWASARAPASAQGPETDGTVVRCDPAAPSVAKGGTTFVDLYLQDVTDLYGADVQLSFDPGLVLVVDADGAIPGTQIQPLAGFLSPDFIIKAKACNEVDPGDPDCATAGRIWYAVTQLNPSPPASGSGPLARVTLRGLSEGTFTASFTYVKLSDRNGVEIPATSQSCLVTVSAPVEPGAYTMYLPVILRGP